MAGIDGLPWEVANRIREEFQKLDVDGDLKVSKDEYENSILAPYVENGYKIPGNHTQDETIGSILAGADKKFDDANVDHDLGGLNIDEFTNMVKDKYLQEYEESKAKKDSEQVNNTSTQPENGNTNASTPNSNALSPNFSPEQQEVYNNLNSMSNEQKQNSVKQFGLP